MVQGSRVKGLQPLPISALPGAPDGDNAVQFHRSASLQGGLVHTRFSYELVVRLQPHHVPDLVQ